MTTPGGVSNLPMGALTLETLASNLQDMTSAAMKSRAVERFPSIFDNSTGLSPASEITPFGILTSIWAQVNALIANADPADIQGPEDLPELVLDFIEGLPIIGQLVELLEAILGTYDGDDIVLQQVQAIFAPIRAFMQLLTGLDTGFPSVDDVTSGFGQLAGLLPSLYSNGFGLLSTALDDLFTDNGNGTWSFVGDEIHDLIDTGQGVLVSPMEWIQNLGGQFGIVQHTLDTQQGLIDTLFNSVNYTDLYGVELERVLEALRNIPYFNVLGVGGPGNIGDSLATTWDQIVGGSVGAIGSGSTLSNVFNALLSLGSDAAQGPMAFNLFGGLNTSRATWRGLLPSSDTTMNFSSLLFNKVSGTPTMPTVNVPAGTEYINWEVVQQDTDKQVVQWHGKVNTGITDLRYRIWKMDPTTGTASCLHTSTNRVGTAGTSAGENTYTATTPISWKQGDIFGVGLHPIGGSLDILGDDTWHTYNSSTVFPRRSASLHPTRGTSTATPANITGTAMESLYTSKYAHLEYALNSGNPAAPHLPESHVFTSGSGTLPVPDWCNDVFLIAVAGGGKGYPGSGTVFVNGRGGGAGSITTLHLVRGTHFTTGAIVDWSVGGGSTGGNAGNSTSGIGANTTTSVGGSDGSGWITGSGTYGGSPGSVTVDGNLYQGGAAQTSAGSAGNPAGGGGAGGPGGFGLAPGGNGARGEIVVKFKQ